MYRNCENVSLRKQEELILLILKAFYSGELKLVSAELDGTITLTFKEVEQRDKNTSYPGR